MSAHEHGGVYGGQSDGIEDEEGTPSSLFSISNVPSNKTHFKSDNLRKKSVGLKENLKGGGGINPYATFSTPPSSLYVKPTLLNEESMDPLEAETPTSTTSFWDGGSALSSHRSSSSLSISSISNSHFNQFQQETNKSTVEKKLDVGDENILLLSIGAPKLTIQRKLSASSENSEGLIGWKKGLLIGEGSFGMVYRALDEVNGLMFAAKKIQLPLDASKSDIKSLRMEIKLMKNLNHPNIVRYLGSDQVSLNGETSLWIYMEYVPGGSIHSLIKQFGSFSDSLIERYTYQIVLGVEYLHSKSIVHRDLKGANVLVSDKGVVKLSDFGCSRQLQTVKTVSLGESLMSLKGSLHWMAPEAIRQSSTHVSMDIWSLGCVIIEMKTGKPPWPIMSNDLASIFKIANSTDPPSTPVWHSPISSIFYFLLSCLGS